MTHTVHFADRTLVVAAAVPDGEWYVWRPAPAEPLSRVKIVQILESHKRVALVAADPDAAFAVLAAEFTSVTAAGGVVVDEAGARLMMRRNGRWDLPKGHLEAGESLEACAEREIAEETGIEARAVRPLCRTMHAYWFPPTGRWELKTTHWYELRRTGGTPVPQGEEGIAEVRWCTPAEARAHAAESFPTIRRVMEALDDGANGAA